MQKQKAAESDLLKKHSSQSEVKSAESEIIPATQHILDSYPRLSVAEKNSAYLSEAPDVAKLLFTGTEYA